MALSPTIPTSFVPRQVPRPKRFHTDFTGAFGFFAYVVLAVIALAALVVFVYGRILSITQSGKDAQLVKTEASVDPAEVEGFIRLRDRLSSGGSLLKNHLALTGFFSALESVLPVTVQFSKLHLSVGAAGAVKLEAGGVAQSFNSLAALSSNLASDGRIKDAIFSNIAVSQKDGTVSFALSAELDPKLTAFAPPVATTTATSSPTATATTSASTTTASSTPSP